jgi:hypothetical protein
VDFYDGPYLHPDGVEVDGLCVHRTIKACKRGEEALRNYGSTYRKAHFTTTEEERDESIQKAKNIQPPTSTQTSRAARAEKRPCFVQPFKLGLGSFHSSRKPVVLQPVTPSPVIPKKRRTHLELLLTDCTSETTVSSAVCPF